MPAVLAIATVTGTIRDEDGTLTDPLTLTAAVTNPEGELTSVSLAGGTITRSSAGIYTFDASCDVPGLWHVEWEAKTSTLRRSLKAQWEVSE